MDSVTLPYLTNPAIEEMSVSTVMASEEQRFAVLGRLLKNWDIPSLTAVPPAHVERGPLSVWCWLVLKVNGIEPEYNSIGQPYPLTHYGIDLGFCEAAVSKWVFFLA